MSFELFVNFFFYIFSVFVYCFYLTNLFVLLFKFRSPRCFFCFISKLLKYIKHHSVYISLYHTNTLYDFLLHTHTRTHTGFCLQYPIPNTHTLTEPPHTLFSNPCQTPHFHIQSFKPEHINTKSAPYPLFGVVHSFTCHPGIGS